LIIEVIGEFEIKDTACIIEYVHNKEIESSHPHTFATIEILNPSVHPIRIHNTLLYAFESHVNTKRDKNNHFPF